MKGFIQKHGLFCEDHVSRSVGPFVAKYYASKKAGEKDDRNVNFNNFHPSSRTSPSSSSLRTTPSLTTTPSRPRSTRPPARGTAPESETSSPRKSRAKKTL